MRPFLPALLVAAAIAAPVLAAAPSPLQVEHPWSRPAPKGGTGAGYISITNTGTAPDRLVSASTPIAQRVEMHQSMVMNNMAMMHPLPGGLAIPAGTTAVFAPGGYHLMLVGLKQPLAMGDSFPMTLKFEKAGPTTVTFKVEAAGPPMGGMKH